MCEVVGERHLGALFHERGGHLEAVVRVHAPHARPRDRRALIERQPGSMREQVAERRAGRPGRLVEIDEPFLGRHEHRNRRRELGHRRPREPAAHLAVRRFDEPGHADRDVLARPTVDLAQGIHEPRD